MRDPRYEDPTAPLVPELTRDEDPSSEGADAPSAPSEEVTITFDEHLFVHSW